MEANPDVLVQQLRALVENPEAFASGFQRQEIMKLSRQAATLLEDPFEMFQRLAYSVCQSRDPGPDKANKAQPLPLITARVAQEHGIFKTLVDSKDGPTSAAVLAEKTRLNPNVLDSLLAYMTTQHMIQETSPRQYSATKLSQMLLAPLFIDGVLHL